MIRSKLDLSPTGRAQNTKGLPEGGPKLDREQAIEPDRDPGRDIDNDRGIDNADRDHDNDLGWGIE